MLNMFAVSTYHFGDAVHQPTWPLLQKIEHGKIAGFR
jgi:hypothetical protein